MKQSQPVAGVGVTVRRRDRELKVWGDCGIVNVRRRLPAAHTGMENSYAQEETGGVAIM
jgi:hypothetical protein